MKEQEIEEFEQWIYEEIFDCQDNYLPAKIIKRLKKILTDHTEPEGEPYPHPAYLNGLIDGLKVNENQITKRKIEEFLASTPQKFTIEEMIAIEYCYHWLDKDGER